MDGGMESTVPGGLSTYDALNRLHDDIETTLNNYKEQIKNRILKQWLNDALHYKSPHTTFNIISAILILITIIIFQLPNIIYDQMNYELLISSIILFIILMMNLYLVIIENQLRHSEIPKKVTAILATLKLAIKNVKWSPENYPHLCTPFSPCVTLQWVYRDGALVNLPWALLVKDDIIVIRPGQLSPGLCEALDKDSDCLILRQREIYGPSLPFANEIFAIPKSKEPLNNKLYILKETPYLNNLNVALNKALNRPVTQFNKDQYFLFNRCLSMLYFVLLFLILFVNIIKYNTIYYDLSINYYFLIDLFLLEPFIIVLPLLPIIFPTFWIGLNTLGLARFKTFFNNTSKNSVSSLKIESDHFPEPESLSEVDIDFKYRWSEVWDIFINILNGKELMMTRSANILHVFAQLSALCVVDKKGILSWPNPTAEKVFFLKSTENTSETSSIDSHINNDVSIVIDTNIENDDEQQTTTINSNNHKTIKITTNKNKYKNKYNYNNNESAIEVLDMTHNQNVPFKLEFDDHEWKQHLTSLKPLGLAILLNTCNMETQESYSKFCSHITCEAMYNEHLVPVANRRCLCELSKQIGFIDSTATNIFNLEEQISTFRHLQSDMVRKDKLAKALHLTTKLKFPFPHMVAVIVKELNIDSYQLFSQGTADIILDSCIDYWNGIDIQPLTTSDRKKITDFYSRTSLTSYCTAFGYKPLLNLNNSIRNNRQVVVHPHRNIYFELPSNSKLYHHQYFNNYNSYIQQHYVKTNAHQHHHHHDVGGTKSPLSTSFNYHYNKYYIDINEPQHPHHSKGLFNHFHSTDSLLYNTENMINNIEEQQTDDKNKNKRSTNIERCVEMQCNQIFLGMVTMQYQAQSDMVQLIEHLERACIRFVHFSKENELRSRVFSEKMGLESGWNCHISLLSDKSHSSECWANNGTARVWSPSLFPQKVVNRRQNEKACNDEETQLLMFSTNLETSKTMSISAPSAINLDCTVVKFDEDNTILECGNNDSLSPDDDDKSLKPQESDEEEDDSVMVHSVDLSSHQEGWPSLSCLTDSTEQSAPVNFDMSNRAKLPRGIENIRPHLESIDNVPLLVSLFTDCTPDCTTEMLHIMQDYDQSVCVLGSVANADNIDVFMQANVSIAVEPLYPQLCQHTPVFTSIVNPVYGPSPIGLNRSLNSLPCALTFCREDPVSLFHLILESRHFMFSLWNCLQFWICSISTITFLQLIIIILFLPPLLSIHQILWFTCIIIPFLSMSFIGNQKDPNIMQRPAQKLQSGFNYDMILFIIWNYCGKFISLIICTIIIYGGLLYYLCENYNIINNNNNNNSTITIININNLIIYHSSDSYNNNNNKIHKEMTELEPYILYIKHVTIFIIVLHLCVLSINFVHRDHLTWKRNPFKNHLWTVTILFICLLQTFYTILNIYLIFNLINTPAILSIPWFLIIFIFLSPFCTFIIADIIKWQEIQVNLRYLRRARLEFGTKLGMNSPF